ncbi:antibiotic biosynthesis monooxygenase [Putridiphycobacter roseus]|uniref:Antibiotic biosynthesis monooxygenase n=1 Tax=Putridiphycobacter roseus TaxID=2219161 RepID=A0A2W1NID6_9FLAO|nr:antibiotic biosynthesis monooxygenase family protein [Putridiphycobacter roseus]PZE17686.1 antibiotic biosynthesis monooxygenase [Putridiphycobacter roseus]
MSITRIVKMSFKPEHAAAFEAYFLTIKSKVAGQPGCRGVKLLKEKGETGVFFTYSQWDSEVDLNNYRHTETFGQIWPTVKNWFADKAGAWTVEEM